MENHWLTKRQRREFMGELVEMISTKGYEELRHETSSMDFKPLYSKYPRVRIGIRRALYRADSMRRHLRTRLRRLNATHRTNS